MSRTVRAVLAGILTTAVAVSGCAAPVAGAPVGGNAGPAVVTSSPEFSVEETTGPTTTEVTTRPSTDAESTGQQTTEPSTTDETTDPPTTEEPTGAGADTRVQQFVALIADGMSGITSYQGKISTDMGSVAGGSMTGTMRGTVKDGKAENSEANIAIGMGSQSVEVKVLMVGTRTFIGGSTLLAAVPAAKGKTWILADPNSSNPTIKQLATSMSAAGSSSSSIESFTKFAAAAKSVEKGGSSTVNGVDTTAWTVELDPTKLGSSASAASSATATFHLDRDNRMRRAKIGIEAGGVEIVLTMDMTAYNEPVKITAPSPSTVYTG